MIDLERLRSAPVEHNPFAHLIVPGFVRAEALAQINDDYPNVGKPGSVPVTSVRSGPAFKQLLEEIQSSPMKDALQAKFNVDLNGRPSMVTVRDQCRARDGRIHTDSEGKLVTVLIYLNPAWEAAGGRLRLLRGPHDIDDYAAEVPPVAGTLLAFPCAANAWHGHMRFEGKRRVIQLNWVRDQRYLKRELRRHRFSAFLKMGI